MKSSNRKCCVFLSGTELPPSRALTMYPSALVQTAVLVFLMCCGTHSGLAQNTNAGEIRGTVTDASGAVMPEVKVSLVDIDTGVVKDLLTNSAGIYDAVSILPGNYTITFSKEGFDKLVRSGIVLSVGVITVDGRLSIGVATQQVEVTGEAPLLKTETGEQSATLSTQLLMELPNVTSDWSAYTRVLPGIQGSGQSMSSNGNMNFQANWLSDGGAITYPMSGNTDLGASEALAEVKIMTSTFDAQYGIGGVVANQISKSGTNKFHGAAYEYFQNDFLSARSFFSPVVPVLRYNDWGAALGGAIRKDKVFFYYNHDEILKKSTVFTYYTRPTPDMRAGNFSNTAILPVIYDPTTLSNGVRLPFPNNTIPPSRIDPVAANIQAFFAMPNLPGVSNNWLGSQTTPANDLRQFGRLDYNISSKHRLSGSTTQWDRPTVVAAPDCPLGCDPGDNDGNQVQVTEVWTVSATTVNEFRFAYTRSWTTYTPETFDKGYPQKLGIQYAVADIFPAVTIGGPVGALTVSPGSIYTLSQHEFEPSDVVTMIRGKHIFKFGGELLAWRVNYGGMLTSASLTFGSVFTQRAPFDGKSGLGYADFLTGSVDAWSASITPVTGGRVKVPEIFVQDDYKIRSNLTLNLGLRYQIQKGWGEVANRLGAFDPTLNNPATNTLGAMWFAGNNGRNTIQAPLYDVFLPRFGFAWSPRSKWAVRGGFGLFTYNWNADVDLSSAAGVGSATIGSLSNSDQLQPIFQLSSAKPPLNLVVPSAATRTPSSYNGQNVSYLPYHMPVVHNYQWSFSLQREFQGGSVAEAAFVGNHANDLSSPVDLNQVPASRLGPGNAQLNRPYPQFLSISGDTCMAFSNYNALQLSFRKRFSRGVSFDVNYTWSKFLDDQDSSGFGSRMSGPEYYQNSYNLAANYGLSNFDVPQMFKGDVVYELPVGKGKAFLNRPGLLTGLVGGWRASAIFTFYAGTPFTPIMGTQNQTGSLAGNWYPNIVGNPTLADPTIHAWYNTAAFAQPAAFTYGNSGRNILRGPGMSDVDFSMAKSFAIPKLEAGRLQFRFDATNILNHPSFSNPNNNIGTPAAATITGTTVGGRVLQLVARLTF